MTEFLKSALGYLGNNLSGQQDNDFVGQNVEMGEFKLRVKRVVAEGGFAFVFVAQDSKSGREYALKRLLSSDSDKTKSIINEITSLKKVSGHPNIIRFVAAASIGREESGHGQSEFLILTELCTGGQLVDILKGRNLTPEVVLQIIFQTCSAVHQLHKQRPPLSHRDLKVENLLLSSEKLVKLCDFGSCTSCFHFPDITWSATKRSLVEDELARSTTPMYRAPEMLDLYQNYPINEQADIWALGCVLYLLCYGVHPFEDSAKLRIINGNFSIPQSDIKFIDFHELMRMMLRVHPMERPNIVDILEKLQEIATRLAINPEAAIDLPLGREQPPSSQQPDNNHNNLNSRNSPSLNPASQAPHHSTPQFGLSLFGQLKEGAVNLVKNVKEASSKVVESVSQTVNKGDMDLTYLTTRLIVMSYPGDGVDFVGKNHIDDVRMYLDNRHPCSYAVYNLSGRSYKAVKFENRVSDCGWKQGRSPPFFLLLSICQNMHKWQKQFAKNVSVVHCIDGKSSSAVVACSFICYSQLVDNIDKSIALFTLRRGNPMLSASQKRYINYILELANQTSPQTSPSFPHNRSILLHQITIHPVPCFNKLKNGCRPYVDVYTGEERVVTTLEDYESMRSYTVVDGKVLLQLNVMLTDDVIISVYHARSTIGSKVQGKVTSRKIFDIQIFTGFINPSTKEITFKLNDLDNLDTLDKYPEGFQVSLGISVSEEEREQTPEILKSLWGGSIKRHSSPKHVVSSEHELQKINKELNTALLVNAKPGECKQLTPSNVEDSPSQRLQSKFFVPLIVPETGPKIKSSSRGPPPEKPPPPKILSDRLKDRQIGSKLDDSTRREESIDFDNFSKERNLSGLDDIKSNQSEWANLVDIGEPISEEGVKDSNEDLPLFSEGTVSSGEDNLFDVGLSDPTNLELLMGCTTSSANKSQQSNKDDFFNLFPKDQPTPSNNNKFTSNPFRNGPSTPSEEETKIQKNQPDFTSFHSSFDPFNSISSLKSKKCSTPPLSGKRDTDDFLSFLENDKTASLSGQISSKTIKSGSSDDLLGTWTNENLPSNLNSMPRPSSFVAFNQTSSPLFGSSTNKVTNQLKHPNGSIFAQQKDSSFDPFSKFGNLNLSSKTFQEKISSPDTATTTNIFNAAQFSSGSQQNNSFTFNRPQNPSVAPGFSIIGNRDERGIKKPFGPKPVVAEDAFGDLLGGFTSASRKEPKTIKEIRSQMYPESKDVDPDIDPEILKIRCWVKDKEGDIRNMLCSLHTVLWEGEGKWKQVGFNQLVSGNQVKNVYRKALLCVHPDKLQDNLELAGLIFIELKKAWLKFEESEMR